MKEIFHLFRIDHILGFYRIYAFPWRPGKNREFLPLDLATRCGPAPAAGSRTLRPGTTAPGKTAKLNRREGEEYLRVVLEESGATRVVRREILGRCPTMFARVCGR